MVSPYAKTLRMVVNDTFRFVNDFRGDGKDGFVWSWSELASRANELILDLVRETGILRDTQTIILEEDLNIYDLPPDCIRPLRFMIHGLQGSLILPRTMSELDLVGQQMNVEGDPYYFIKDLLGPDQICFFPTPYRDGSSFTRDSPTGLLRQIKDAEGNYITYDANLPLRRITGVPFTRRGDGRIIREVISPYGNIQVTFIRAPSFWTNPEGYPDSDIPDWIHKDLKYGVSEKVLVTSKLPLHKFKLPVAREKWLAAKWKLQRNIEYVGPLVGCEPV